MAAGSLHEYLAEPGAEPVGLSVSVAMHRCRKRVSTLRCVLLSGLEVAEALRSVHVCGIPHGDLKPQNVLFASDVEVLPLTMLPGNACQPCMPKFKQFCVAWRTMVYITAAHDLLNTFWTQISHNRLAATR